MNIYTNTRLRFLSIACLCGLLAMVAKAEANSDIEWIYHVEKGDTLWDLCRQQLGETNTTRCWKKIQRYNGITVPKRMRPGAYLRIPVSWLKTIPVVASVQFARGEVSQQVFGAANAQPLATGDQVSLGSLVTVADGAAVLKFIDGSELLLRQQSELLVQAMTTQGNHSARTTLSLNKGEVDVGAFHSKSPSSAGASTPAKKKKSGDRFRIKTPGVVAAVRGTEFRVAAQPDGITTQVEVLQGGVDVASDQSGQLVPAGYGVSAVKGQAVEAPRKLLPGPQFERVQASYNVGDVTVQWLPVEGAKSYQLELYKGATGREILLQQAVATASYRFANLAEGDYQLVVRAVSTDGLRGLDSRTLALKTLSQPPAPSLDKKTASHKKKQLTASWQPVDTAHGYVVEVSLQKDFSELLWQQSVTEPTITRQVGTKKPVYIRVKTVSADGRHSEFSEPD